MALFARRERLRALAEREAAGENLWTSHFDDAARQRILYALQDAISDHSEYELLDGVRQLVLRDEGLPYLVQDSGDPRTDVKLAILHLDPPLLLSVLEACSFVLGVHPGRYGTDPQQWTERVNTVLRENRISYELVEGRVVPFDSQEMHVEVVAPTLRLLAQRQGWNDVEEAYQKALKEIGQDPSDAITDAGTALQEALKVRGCEGNALGPLVRDARRKGILAPHDPTFGEAVGKMIDWVGADRSEKGDGHKSATGATPQDAWLAVHVVGALILRLAGGVSRGAP